MQKIKSAFNLGNLITLFLIFLLVYFKWPQINSSLQLEGKRDFSPQQLIDLRGKTIVQQYPSVMVFWASWCKPCEVELARINRMIINSEIKAERVIAVAVDDDKDDLNREIEKRGYKFQVVWDQFGLLSKKYEVTATPTLIVFGQDKSIIWATSGLSPLLELKLRKYLN